MTNDDNDDIHLKTYAENMSDAERYLVRKVMGHHKQIRNKTIVFTKNAVYEVSGEYPSGCAILSKAVEQNETLDDRRDAYEAYVQSVAKEMFDLVNGRTKPKVPWWKKLWRKIK